MLSEWEKLEPDWMEYQMERWTRLYHRLTNLGLSGSDARETHREAEKTALVCIIALHNAHRRLWEKDQDEPPAPPTSPPRTPRS